MGGTSRIIGAVCAGLVVLSLSGCAQRYRTHGYAPTQAELDSIEVGLDTRDTVRVIIGDPVVTGVVADQAWFYVKSEFLDYAWRAPQETGRTVVGILFDERGRVANIETYGIEDGQVVALSRRVSDSGTTGVGLLQQIIGNVGNFNPLGALGGDEGI
ncbi:outer membrane protein assembly factor BamE [Palleronia sp. KMU-117]|uniref:outer membrane protein assembly factor BamE n=1 Tax=Palleronia sp. KMU-117 TaxID=3434108 RepID=UPI003D71E0AB